MRVYFLAYRYATCFLACNSTQGCVAFGMVGNVCHMCYDNDTTIVGASLIDPGATDRFYVWLDYLQTIVVPEPLGERIGCLHTE